MFINMLPLYSLKKTRAVNTVHISRGKIWKETTYDLPFLTFFYASFTKLNLFGITIYSLIVKCHVQ